jgi:hypothetical protein
MLFKLMPGKYPGDLNVCMMHLQAKHFLQPAAGMAVPRLQFMLAEVMVGTTLLAHKTVHQATRCALLLVPDSRLETDQPYSSKHASAAALHREHQVMKQRLVAVVEGQQQQQQQMQGPSVRRLHSKQLEQFHTGSQWRAAARGCLVTLYMHYALILASQQQDSDQCHLIFRQSAQQQAPMLANAVVLAKEMAVTHSLVGLSVLRALVHVLRSWQVDAPPALIV